MAAASSTQRTTVLGLTGGIAAGKSQALAAFERAGAATLSSDAIVHELLGTERVRDLLVGRWGAEVAPEGEIDRAKVGSIVFEDPEELAWLEATLHPLVAEQMVSWRRDLDPGIGVAVVEVPLLFEADLDAVFDATVAIVARDSLRADRAEARGTRDLERRERRQLSQEEKAKRATYVVENDAGIEELDKAIRALVDELAATEGDAA